MRAVARFWIGVLSLIVSVAAVGYLFVTFLYPETALVFRTRSVRLAVMFVALLGIGALVWSAVLVDNANGPSGTPKNRNR
jgi:hypothetical protein